VPGLPHKRCPWRLLLFWRLLLPLLLRPLWWWRLAPLLLLLWLDLRRPSSTLRLLGLCLSLRPSSSSSSGSSGSSGSSNSRRP
jgi:hypothetical protein